MGQAERCAAHGTCGMTCCLTESAIHKGHQHAAMYHAVAIGMDVAGDKRKLRLFIDNPPQKPADMADKPVVRVKRPAGVFKILFHAMFLQRIEQACKLPRRGVEADCLLCSPDV